MKNELTIKHPEQILFGSLMGLCWMQAGGGIGIRGNKPSGWGSCRTGASGPLLAQYIPQVLTSPEHQPFPIITALQRSDALACSFTRLVLCLHLNQSVTHQSRHCCEHLLCVDHHSKPYVPRTLALCTGRWAP